MNEQYMRRAITLAKQGIGRVNPNPLVGAVIVRDDRIVAEGFHARYGELHAERQAFAALSNPELARGAELYVTLEPCCHHGKQPPCTQAIIEHGIRRVYVGSDDPNALVAGKGIRQLQDAGIEVQTHVIKEECDALNPVFFHYISTGLPYVVMKYAMTMDGKIACESGESKWVTGEDARAHVQQTRNALRGIMVGVQTVLQDNPRLSCRIPEGRNPVRIVCDSHLRTPEDSELVKTAGEQPVWIATLPESMLLPQAKRLLERGAELLSVPEEPETHRVSLQQLMKVLGERKIDGILLEGGATLHAAAMEAGIVNHAQVYIAPKWFGGSGRYTPLRGNGVAEPAQAWKGTNRKLTMLGDDILVEYDIAASQPCGQRKGA